MTKTKVYVDEKGMHDGHRKRLIDLVDRVGIENVTKVQALEFILFFIFPRGDVNPLAHRLLDRFNNVPTIMEASVEDLQEVRGMGETSAKKLRSLLEVFIYYSTEKLSDDDTLKSLGDFYDYIEQVLRYRPDEELYIYGINDLGEIMKGRKFGKGTHEMVSIDLRDISLYISSIKVRAVFMVHNHPNGSCYASKQDEVSYEALKGKFSFSGCSLRDMLIVGREGVYSIERKCIIRFFNKGAEYSQLVYLGDLQ